MNEPTTAPAEQPVALLELDPAEIEAIVRAVPGGIGNVEDIYPLSQLQEGLLFHRLMDERGDTYIESLLFELQSQRQLEALTNGLQSAVDRHDILRSAVLWEGLQAPVQVICRHARLPIAQLVLDPDRDALDQLQSFMRPGQQRFDLRQAPLARLRVVDDAHGGRIYAVLQIHHLICDFQSLRILIAELTAHLTHRPESLPPPVPYREYVERSLATVRKDPARKYFAEQLGHIEEPTAPFGVVELHEGAGRMEEASCTLDPALTEQLRVQARRVGVSVAVMLHAAWAVVVARTSGCSDVVFGTVLSTARRHGDDARRGLGMALNTLPLRLQLDELTVQALLEQTQRELAQLARYEQTPLTLAQGCSGITGTAPLFTALLNYRRSARDVYADLEQHAGIRVVAHREAWTNYPVTLSADDGVDLTLSAQTDRQIDPRRMVGYVAEALRSLVTALERTPQALALSLAIMPMAERRRVLTLFNQTESPYPHHALIHELFEVQVRRTPDALAALHDSQSLTYAELNARANRLARRLRNEGVGPDQIVAICVNRSLDVAIGLLAILKAGGAYLPLDPSYPTERLQWMLDDAAPRVLLTHSNLRNGLPNTQAQVIALDQEQESPGPLDQVNAAAGQAGMSSLNLVYVIFTSGSTGRPKGIGMPHCAMSNLLEWQRQALPLTHGQRVLQFAALSFDVAFQEIFSTLCAGGTLVFADEWERRDASALVDILARQRIERLFVPPLMLQSLAEYATTKELALDALDDVIVAGERLRVSPEIVSLFRQLRDCRLHNHYGPTETHVVTALTLDSASEPWPALPSIGRPIANTQIYLLDTRGEPVPLGVRGEIHIGGANVARGYINRSQLTSERFLPDLFGRSGARLYRTGDLGRWLDDGTIEYLGRNDDQVKVRGFRIELGEIESLLAAHPSVKEAAVVLRESSPGDKRLVAYITARSAQVPDTTELRAHLKSALPDHMIPSAIVTLDHVPVTPSGKLNRRALPAPHAGLWVNKPCEAPSGDIEQQLAELWCELLEIRQVGRDDSFFDLGGHSLLAMRLLARIQTALAVKVPIRALFERPTLQSLAATVQGLRRAQLLDSITTGGTETEHLLDTLVAMSESQAQEMLRRFATEGRL